ncbi:uncharacterized protein [Watersipora subatra]|uniref:uncharacterized protein isoform X2 n=1 Tax=Watersipora subatra TaxID=2589382 RepID=UPI00355ADD3B
MLQAGQAAALQGALCTTGIRYGACRIGAASLVSQTLPDNPDTLPKSKDLDAKFSTQVHANCGYLRTRIYQSIMFLTKNCVKLKANSPLSAIQNRSWNWPWKVWCGRYLHSSLSSGSQRRAEPSFRLQKPARICKGHFGRSICCSRGICDRLLSNWRFLTR